MYQRTGCELREEETPTGTVYYIREPDGSLVTRVEGSVTQYYHFDELGSTRLLTSAAGVVTDTYTYDGWGNVSHDTGSAAQPYQYIGKLGYYTHYQDANLDLLQLGVRFYDPEVGRFTQRDPVQSQSSLYAYTENRPTTAVDPLGTSPVLAACIVVAYLVLDCRNTAEEVFDEVWNWPHKHSGTAYGGDKLVHCMAGCLINLRADHACAWAAARSTERKGGNPFGKVTGDPLDEKAALDGVSCGDYIRCNRGTIFGIGRAEDVTGNEWLDCIGCCQKKGYRRWK